MKNFLAYFLVLINLTACVYFPKGEKSVSVPVADKVPFEHKLHNDVRIDNYQWMNERDSQKVLDYIAKENQYAKNILKPAERIANTLFKEMKGRLKEDESTEPYKMGPFYYYIRYERGKEYPIYCRKKESLEASEEIILDVNALAKGKKYYSAAVIDISPNAEWMTYAVDQVGRRFYTLYFKNLKTGETFKENIPNTTGTWVWANDNKTGFFTKQNPETLRSDTVYRYTLGQNAEPQKIYFEKEDIFNVDISKSLNHRTVFVTSGSFNSSEVRYLPADQPLSELKIFAKREKNHEYSVEDGGDGFYIRTNYGAKNFRLMKAPYSRTHKHAWIQVIPYRENTYLENFIVLKNYLVSEVKEKGLTRIEILDRKSNKTQVIPFPDPVYEAYIGANKEFDSTELRYNYTSLVQPNSVYDYNILTGKSVLKKTKEVPTYSIEDYKTERLWAMAKDGTKIPVSVVYKKDLFKKSANPLFIYAYGSYGFSMPASFNSQVVSLLDRGFVYAIAHIRGGQELGRNWYENGRMMNKKNTFTDFVDVTENLLTEGYGKKGHVYAAGGSAGGLLMGAVLNLRPDLYYGVHAAVPFVDVLTTMLDPNIPLTTGEYEQWGNPNEKKAYEYIKSYSPYDNIKDQAYPNLLITTGYHDSQVQYWEPLKWTAKLRDHNKGSGLILMKTEMSAGHSGVTGRFARTREVADDYAFFVWLEEHNKN